MPDDWDNLTAQQRNEVVATKVMGWHLTHDGIGPPPSDAISTELPKRCRYWSGNARMRPTYGDYCPTENIAQAWEVQERIAALGLEHEWAVRLEGMLDCARMTIDWTWAAAWATPDQRCHAAVLAVEGEQK